MKKDSILKSIIMVSLSLAFVIGIVLFTNANTVDAAGYDGWFWDSYFDQWCYYSDGDLYYGWIADGGNWYYCNPYMEHDCISIIDEKLYLFDGNGHMQRGGWICEWSDGTYSSWVYARSDGSLYNNQWFYENGNWYYFDEWGRMASGYAKTNDGWYRFSSNGAMIGRATGLVGWKNFGGVWFYFDSEGQDANGWRYIGNNWYYFIDGWMVNDMTIYIDNYNYRFDASGVMYTGWYKDLDGYWRYFTSSGRVATGWQKISGKWYYFGTVVDQASEINWCYYENAMFTGWQEIDGNWYYFNGSGVMQTGWVKLGNNYYYFNSNGKMTTGWQKINNQWYYFSANGIMQTGWQTIGGSSYYFYSGGQMAANTWIGNYHVNGSGVYDQRR